MHISEGVLSLPVLLTGGALSVIGIGLGLGKIKSATLPQASIMTAAFFPASFVHVNIGPA